MSLHNLLRIGSLAEHITDPRQVRKMLASAERSVADARQESISPETRLDAAYRGITQASMIGLWANNCRPSRSSPGHHQTMIQSLVHSIGLGRDHMLLLDTFRVKRNAIDYTGEDVDTASAEACIDAAVHLLNHLRNWLAEHRPELLE